MNQEPLPICLNKKSGGNFFDEIVIGRFTRISFHRTLRIPEDGREYPLPAGLGRFPIHRVEDYTDKVPVEWLRQGGFFIPLYQKEALFLQFEGPIWHPTIAKVCVGKINAISGKQYSENLSPNHQDYLVIPHQKWLDGICSGDGLVKQFVAMPLGQGFTIEAQVTDEERFGGFQIVVCGATTGKFNERNPSSDYLIMAAESNKNSTILYSPSGPLWFDREPDTSMGIAAGGSIKQQIHKDTYGIDSWDITKRRGLTVHLVNSAAFKLITGYDPPDSPITVDEYEKAKIPWYSHYDDNIQAVKSPTIFKRIMSISSIEKNRGLMFGSEKKQRAIAIKTIHKIKTPSIEEATENYRKNAYWYHSKNLWNQAITNISQVIDLDFDVRADDFALRSSCNYYLGRFKEGFIDGSLGLKRDEFCVPALTWRAYCNKSLGKHEELSEDAEELSKIAGTELIVLELKAEAALLSKNYDQAISNALLLKKMNPRHMRAAQIIVEAHTQKSMHHNE
jgi:hypothetical protein